MAPSNPKKAQIRAILVERARSGVPITYGDLGLKVGMTARGPWKSVLDEIAREEKAAGLPDITFMVVKKGSGIPGQIGFRPADPATAEQQQLVAETLEAIRKKYRS